MADWITEKHEDFLKVSYKVDRRCFTGSSAFQKIEVIDSTGFGKVLLNDDIVMVSERDEFIYHEMMVHVPLFVHPSPKEVLVVGGGDGGSVREVLRHQSVRKCTLVEIDELVVNTCREHLPFTAKNLTDPRCELIVADAVKYMALNDKKFDIILIDSTDPIGPAQPLFGQEFYINVFNSLSEEGIVVSQGESPFYEVKLQKQLNKILKELFPVVKFYNFSNLTYPGGLWSFTFASKKYQPIGDFRREAVAEAALEFRYYNPDIHAAAFCLPTFMKKNLEDL